LNEGLGLLKTTGRELLSTSVNHLVSAANAESVHLDDLYFLSRKPDPSDVDRLTTILVWPDR
jgi:hypothetical protein